MTSSMATSALMLPGIGHVYVEFADGASAEKALMALKGQPFAGRKVDIKYFPLPSFVNNDLTDPIPYVLTAINPVRADALASTFPSGSTQ